VIKLNDIYSYAYYRIARVYFKYEKDKQLSKFGSALVTLSQVLIIFDAIEIILITTLNETERQRLSDKYFLVFILFAVGLNIYNNFRYMGKYDSYHERWNNDTMKKATIKGIMVVLIMVIPVVLLPIVLIFSN
jgi:hypothetical protein